MLIAMLTLTFDQYAMLVDPLNLVKHLIGILEHIESTQWPKHGLKTKLNFNLNSLSIYFDTIRIFAFVTKFCVPFSLQEWCAVRGLFTCTGYANRYM